MRNKWYIIIVGILTILFLSGCTEINQPITEDSEGFWNQVFVYPLSWLIKYFAAMFSNSYGWAIVVVTIIIRLLLLPLNIKQIKSSRAMQEIQPKMQELQKKYSSKDAKTQQKLQQETMKLFQEHGVNPLAGCLPIFIQMPILIAMYHAIMRTEEIKSGTFLWFSLGSPDYILPIITGIATFIQQKLMMAGSPANQNPQMVAMLYILPIMITVFAFFFPAALALYWVVGNIFMVVQTIFLRNPAVKDASTGGGKK